MLAKELEANGIPVAYITPLDGVARSVGANRIIRGKAITSVVGDPSLRPRAERGFRRELVKKALQALSTQVEEPTIVE